MIRSFKNPGTEDLFNGVDRKAARKICPPDVMKRARLVLGMLYAANALIDLKSPGFRLEKLERDRKGQHAIRINDKYRVCFVWTDHGADALEVTDYH